jgi:hypothetical protein
MATHKNNVYSVNSRLNAHDAQLLELDKAIKSVVLSPGPVGKQGATGASGADGKNGRDGRDGKDSTIAGPIGPPGRAGTSIKGDKGDRGERGPAGKDGESIKGEKGDKGDTGAQGPRGDVTVIGESELAQAVLDLRRKLKEQHATFIAHLIEGIEANRRPGSSPHARILASHLETILAEIRKLG